MKRVQSHRSLAVASPLEDDKLLIRSITAVEQLGRPFSFDLELNSEDHEIKPVDLLAQNMTVRVEQPSGGTRYFNGYVARWLQVSTRGSLAHYRATLVPWLWFLTRSAKCRIFQQKSVPEIIKQILGDWGFSGEVQDKLQGEYQPCEYCVQYRESDFNFISRLMEQEGIYYYFAHTNGQHSLVLADSATAHAPVEGYEEIFFHHPERVIVDREFISSWIVEQNVQAGCYAHTDYDFVKPRANLLAIAKGSKIPIDSKFEVFDFPGNYATTGAGDRYADIRLEELQTEFEVARGETDSRGITTGAKFTLGGHSREDQNKAYVVLSTVCRAVSDEYGSHNGEVDPEAGTYRCEFTAIDAVTQFRPTRSTRRPTIAGPQTAVVVGKAGEEIWTDAHGRVKVQFHWDSEGKADEKSSCFIRVSQPVAGKKWGSINIPRVGQEVVVEFLEGDPDRPLITGRVYNGVNQPPYPLPANATMTTMKTNSSKGGNGFNEIRFQDKKGEEQLFFHAEKNQDVRVKNDTFEWIGNNRHLIVKTDQFEHVENNRNEKVDADHMEEIGKDRHLKVVGKEAIEVGGSHSFTVKGDVIEVFKANHCEQTTNNYYIKAKGIVIEASQGITIKCGGNSLVIDSAGVTIKGAAVTIDSSMIKLASGPGSSPASGSACSAVAPAAPADAEEADCADPGEMEEVKAEQRKQETGKYGSVPIKPYKQDPTKTSWIEIKLVDEDDKPVAGAKYRITLANGETLPDWTLDEKGFARVDGIDPGTCTITFPDLDQDAWEPA